MDKSLLKSAQWPLEEGKIPGFRSLVTRRNTLSHARTVEERAGVRAARRALAATRTSYRLYSNDP